MTTYGLLKSHFSDFLATIAAVYGLGQEVTDTKSTSITTSSLSPAPSEIPTGREILFLMLSPFDTIPNLSAIRRFEQTRERFADKIRLIWEILSTGSAISGFEVNHSTHFGFPSLKPRLMDTS